MGLTGKDTVKTTNNRFNDGKKKVKEALKNSKVAHISEFTDTEATVLILAWQCVQGKVTPDVSFAIVPSFYTSFPYYKQTADSCGCISGREVSSSESPRPRRRPVTAGAMSIKSSRLMGPIPRPLPRPLRAISP